MDAELPDGAVQPADRAEWRRWLEENHERCDGVWLVTYKRSSGKGHLTYEEAVEEALCFGWIDSQGKSIDRERTMLRYSPRRAGSAWARSNKERVRRLAEAGLMAPAGLARVEAAKRDGSWTALDAVEAGIVPADLELALRADAVATANFEAFPPSARRAFLAWVTTAKRGETRARRIEATVRAAAENRRQP